MFIAYTDASVQAQHSYLAFVIEFEDKRIIQRRIVIGESYNNVAEALAINELLSFLEYHNIHKGVILMDCVGVIKHLAKRKSKLSKIIGRNFKRTLRKLGLRTQTIPRRYNFAHRVCKSRSFFRSHNVSEINRNVYQNIIDFPQYMLDFSAYLSYIKLIGKNRPYHTAVRKLNTQIWLGRMVSEVDESIVYEYYNRRLEVKGNIINRINLVSDYNKNCHRTISEKKKKLIILVTAHPLYIMLTQT
ncbi:hypothetical protein ACFQ4X_05520 [Fictibacillus halophilus]|uniref:hypothetical protein n=1 Tax=Fictibacillus halophilus TaxID=1610490 RepID=UPI003640E24F